MAYPYGIGPNPYVTSILTSILTQECVHYTKIGPMPRDTAQISGSLGPILISGALGPEDIRRYPGHMTRDPCAQPFPRP